MTNQVSLNEQDERSLLNLLQDREFERIFGQTMTTRNQPGDGKILALVENLGEEGERSLLNLLIQRQSERILPQAEAKRILAEFDSEFGTRIEQDQKFDGPPSLDAVRLRSNKSQKRRPGRASQRRS